jgi:LacI family repressor for deo operon, udp, cdd, tsx, nupC, and nupG
MTAEDVARLARQRPMVLLGERFTHAAADHVAVDSVSAARDATRHLIGLGRRRIAFIGAQTRIGTAAMRLAGYQSALNEAGRGLDENLIVGISPFHRTQGAEAMATLLKAGQPPDAVFCVNDLLALGAIRTLLSTGLRVPEDVAVIGFDDIEDGRYTSPTLTSISPNKQEIAEVSVELLARRIQGGAAEPAVDVVAGHRLQLRESTGGTAVTSGPLR